MRTIKDKKKIKPFFRWMGGKSRFTKQLMSRLPKDFNIYFEPFVGAGSLLLALQPERFYISDSSKALINTWKTMSNSEATMNVISTISNLNVVHSLSTYYDMRDLYNHLIVYNSKHAATLIYLMHYCFNGVYRTNPRGEFNSPFNNSLKPINTDKFKIINNYLENSMHEIRHQDFAKTLEFARKGDFVYLDPPYDNEAYKKHHYEHSETMEEFQLRLFNEVEKLNEKGVKFMMTNASTERIINLYSPKYYVEEIEFKNIMRGDRTKKQTQLIIRNYRNEE